MRILPLLLASIIALPACGGEAEPLAALPASPSSDAAGERVQLGTDGGNEYRLSVAPDGRTALFSHGQGPFSQTRDSTIYEVQRDGDGWSDPVEVSFVGEQSSDIDAVHSADGNRAWFSSIRPVDGSPRTDVDVWFVDRSPGGGWGEPQHAGGGVNSPGDDLYPSLGPDGSLYVGSDRSGSGFDLYRALPAPGGGFQEAEALPEPLNSYAWEFNPAFTADGRWLVFTARDRPDGAGAGDLLAAQPTADGWTDPQPIEHVSTSSDEYHPSFSPDGERMFFVRGGRLMQVPLPEQLDAGANG